MYLIDASIVFACILLILGIGVCAGDRNREGKILDFCKQDKVYHFDMNTSIKCDIYYRQ